MHKIHLLSVTLAAALFASACTGTPTATTAAPISDVPPSGYPASEATTPEGYPGQPEFVDTTLITPQPLETAPETAPGTASLTGVLVARGGGVIIDTTFFITPGQGPDGVVPPEYLGEPDPARGEVAGRTDAQGRFSLANLVPGKYFLFVASPYGWREAEASSSDQNPLLIELSADQRLALGIANVSWP